MAPNNTKNKILRTSFTPAISEIYLQPLCNDSRFSQRQTATNLVTPFILTSLDPSVKSEISLNPSIPVSLKL